MGESVFPKMEFNLEKAAALLLIVPDFKQCQTFGHTKTQKVLHLWVCPKSIACRLNEAGSPLFGAVYLQHAKKNNKKKDAIWGVTRNAIFMKCDSTASVLCN